VQQQSSREKTLNPLPKPELKKLLHRYFAAKQTYFGLTEFCKTVKQPNSVRCQMKYVIVKNSRLKELEQQREEEDKRN
jgi:hypothetical protein